MKCIDDVCIMCLLPYEVTTQGQCMRYHNNTYTFLPNMVIYNNYSIPHNTSYEQKTHFLIPINLFPLVSQSLDVITTGVVVVNTVDVVVLVSVDCSVLLETALPYMKHNVLREYGLCLQ